MIDTQVRQERSIKLWRLWRFSCGWPLHDDATPLQKAMTQESPLLATLFIKWQVLEMMYASQTEEIAWTRTTNTRSRWNREFWELWALRTRWSTAWLKYIFSTGEKNERNQRKVRTEHRHQNRSRQNEHKENEVRFKGHKLSLTIGHFRPTDESRKRVVRYVTPKECLTVPAASSTVWIQTTSAEQSCWVRRTKIRNDYAITLRWYDVDV